MPLVTRQLSRGLTRINNGQRETVEYFQVTGDDVRTREAAESADARFAVNAPHPTNARARLRDRSTSGVPTNFLVECVYAEPVSGQWVTGETDPLSRKWRVRVLPTVERYEADRAVDGKPVQNAAGDPFSPGITAERNGLVLEYSGYFANPTEYLFHWKTYANRVNSGDFVATVGGSFTVGKGNAKCIDVIAPDEFDWDSNDPIRGVIRVELRTGKHPFQERRRNRGFRAWYLDPDDNNKPKQGRITTLDGGQWVPVSQEIDLDIRGAIAVPFLDSYRVTTAGRFGIVASPVVASYYDHEEIDGITFVYIKSCDEADFSGLIPARN